MNNLSLKTKLIGIIATLGVILIAIFKIGLGGPATQRPSDVTPAAISENAAPTITSTTPPDLITRKIVTVLPTQSLEISFNKPLENVPETKITIDPKTDFDATLTNGDKTIKLTPKNPLILGQGYTLFIKADTKFKGGETLGHDEDLHFATISYSGV